VAAAASGPDVVGVDVTGWWAYVFGDLIGACIAVALIALVRGMPDKAGRKARFLFHPGLRSVSQHPACVPGSTDQHTE